MRDAEQTTIPGLACPLCRGTTFEQEEGKIDSKFGFTAHKVRMLICTSCRHILFFGLGKSIFSLD